MLETSLLKFRGSTYNTGNHGSDTALITRRLLSQEVAADSEQ